MAQSSFFIRLARSGAAYFWDWVIEHWPALFVLGGGSLMTYLASVSQAMQDYGPLAWGVFGIASALLLALVFVMIAWGLKVRVRAKYDNLVLEHGSVINPLDMIFERKRILLNDFVLPSHAYINGKTFIDCDIVGPANIYLLVGNHIDAIRPPRVDVVWLAPEAAFFNGITLTNCMFRNCSFQRVTVFSGLENFEPWKNVPHINWISISPTSDQIQKRLRIIAREPLEESFIEVTPEKPKAIRAPRKPPALAKAKPK